MKLLLITVLVGAALAKPTVQPPRQSEENSTEDIKIPRADAESAKSFPLLRGAAPTRTTSSSVEEEDLQKKPVDKIKTKVRSATQTYTVSSVVPTKVVKQKSAAQTYIPPSAKVAFSAPATKAEQFTPMFTTSDEDQDGDVVVLDTALAAGSILPQPESAQPVGGVSTDSTVDALPAEETATESTQPIVGEYSVDSTVDTLPAEKTATESTQPIAGKYTTGPTVDAVDPVDKTEVAEPEFITYSKNFAVVHNYAVAPSVYSVAGGLPAYSAVPTVDALPAEETATESSQPIAGEFSAVTIVDALPAEETATESSQPIAGEFSDDSTEDAEVKIEVVEPEFTTYYKNIAVVPSYAVVHSVYSVAGGLPAYSTVDALPTEETATESAQPIAGEFSAVPIVDALPTEETATESAQPIAGEFSAVPIVDALPAEETATESAQPIAGEFSAVPIVDALPAEETTTDSSQPIAGEFSDDSTEDAVDPVDKIEVVEPEFTTYSKNLVVVPSYAVVPSVYSVAGVLPASRVSTIPLSQNFVSTNQIYSESNRVYTSPSVYSSPFIYHNQGIVPSYVYHEDD